MLSPRAARSRRFRSAPSAIAKLTMLSAARVSGSVWLLSAATKSSMTPRCPPTRSAGSSGGTSIGSTLSKRPSRPLVMRSARYVVEPVPDDGSALADDAPTALPTRPEPNRAPTAAIVEGDSVFEFEERRGRRAALVPGVRRFPFDAIDRTRRPTGEVARDIKRVDRHVHQQDMIHCFAKTAEMRGDEEFAVEACQRPQRARNRETASTAGHWRHSVCSA